MMTPAKERQRIRDEEAILADFQVLLSGLGLPDASAALGPTPSHGWRNIIVTNRGRSSELDALGFTVAPDKAEALAAVLKPILSDDDLALIQR